MLSTIRRWLAQPKFTVCKPIRAPRRPTFRPEVEVLETRLVPSGLTTLASFDGANGANPNSDLIEDASGNLFGTTTNGGAYGYGAVFEIKAGSDAITILASFDRTNGGPVGPLLEDSHGDLFGTTIEANVNVISWRTPATVFELKNGSGTITTLAHFGAGGLVLDANGDLFGYAWSGTDFAPETLVELKAGSNNFTAVYSFYGTGWHNGGVVADASGNIYGMAFQGGYEQIFEVRAGSDTLTFVASFSAVTGWPQGDLIVDDSGDLFGDIMGRTIFELKAGGNTITTLPANFPTPLASFNDIYGANDLYRTYPPLLKDALGNLFGTTWAGGANKDGTVFEIASPDAAQIAFVKEIYEQLLHRAPESGGLVYWNDQLDSGVAPSTVIQAIEQSTEYRNDQVTALYQRYLHRDAEPGGLTAWTGLLAGGGSIEQVTQGIVSSPEYYTMHGGTLKGYVDGIYHDVLGRPADHAGEDSWLQVLAGGASRQAVAMGFLTSTEHDTDLVDSDYDRFLGRPADSAGREVWVRALQSGMSDEAVLAAVLGSAVGQANFSKEPELVWLYSGGPAPGSNSMMPNFITTLGKMTESQAIDVMHEFMPWWYGLGYQDPNDPTNIIWVRWDNIS